MAVHKSAMGKAVDMSSLASKNEKTRAVGNMNVNARGDVVDSHNRVIQDNTQRVKASYQNTVSSEAPAHLTPNTPARPTAQLQEDVSVIVEEPVELLEEEKELFESDDEEETK